MAESHNRVSVYNCCLILFKPISSDLSCMKFGKSNDIFYVLGHKTGMVDSGLFRLLTTSDL